MFDELIVVWNGVNDGRDGDYLAAPRTPEKRPGAPFRVQSRVGNRELVRRALPKTPGTAVTLGQLVRRTGLGAQSVNGALYLLRQHGTLLSAPLHPGDPNPRPPQKYWRRA